jgi:hypothetical protein
MISHNQKKNSDAQEIHENCKRFVLFSHFNLTRLIGVFEYVFALWPRSEFTMNTKKNGMAKTLLPVEDNLDYSGLSQEAIVSIHKIYVPSFARKVEDLTQNELTREIEVRGLKVAI